MVAIKQIALLAGLIHLIAAAQDAITGDTHFYGQSPPVYPSPEMVGGNEWEAAFQKAKALVGRMTLEEKVNLTAGVTAASTCSGMIPAIKRLKFPGMCLSDAGNGLRNTDFVSGFPSGIHVGASWSKDLAFRRAATMGGEFKKKGVNVLLGPVVGPAWRTVRGGRNWEGISVDPWLAGVLVSQTVSGIQGQGVITSTKRVNNSYGCANSKTLNGLLKTELGFQGFVVSDWGAQHAGVATAKAGLDVAMPGAGNFWGDHLVQAVKNGSLPESRVTDMATRVVASWYQFNQDHDFPKPGIGMPSNVLDPHEIVDGRDPAAAPVLLNGAIEGHVLVKNTKNTLPLRSPRMLSLFGYSAKTPDAFNPSSNLLYSQNWIAGMEALNRNFVSENGQATFGENGTLFGGCGSGAITPALTISPFEALKTRAYQDGTALFNDFISDRPSVEPTSDACVVFGNAWACEGYDRPAIQDDYTDSLIKSVADQCNKTIVVFHNAGPRLVDGFVDHPNVTAVIFAHLPGQESGLALVSLLYGETSPSGKLPYTVAKNESDYGKLLDPVEPEGEFVNFPQADFSEGVYLDYRYFDKNGIEPRYEFGFGLSYTTFAYSNISINYIDGANTYPWPGGPVVSGGQTDLWDAIATVSVNVKNTGRVAGAEVAQLYVGIPGAPAKQLRGFEKPFLQPNQTETVTFHLTRRDLSVWSVERQKWQLQQGTYKFYVGSSSRRLPLNGTMHL
ncbi:glycoside hydrolase family 3 [Trichoderma arundinaceum]|uniref:beta-glucosidase n=1 Tax=Trichoderma arundinaceum TaxID=490622 RepID=A0A395NUE2_TRIAR|nr:glycoside hydrolase family 3 [Trichoderma arundinaceum]